MEKLITYRPTDHVWIVCTGESLNGFDLGILSGLNVIAVNKAFLYLETVDAMLSVDCTTYEDCHEILKRLDIPLVATNRGSNKASPAMQDLQPYELEITGVSGIDDRPGKLRWAFNAGYSALHFAYTQGARKIHLLGMDLTHKHFYDGDELTGNSSHYVEPYLWDFMKDMDKDTEITYYGPYGFKGFKRKPLSAAVALAQTLKQEVTI